MKKEKEENTDETRAAQANYKSELAMPVWSVVTFDGRAAENLTYAEAAEKLKSLKAEKVSGLCVVTDEAATRLAAKNAE